MNKVKLVAITQPRIEGIQTSNELISYCARVSNPTNQLNTETADKLLAYCIKNKHWSIFEMVHVVMEIETSRDIARQILRHRSFSFQEFSQRYSIPLDSSIVRQARLQDSKNRQKSIVSNNVMLQEEWEKKQIQLSELSKELYDWAIENGIAKECARSILPEGLTLSRLYVSGNLRSWMHYCLVRRGNGTQPEHIDIADKAWEILCNEFSFLREMGRIEV